jgi:hypothetical protein
VAAYHRVIGWAALVALGAFRPGVDRVDRRLASICWSVPSAWNAVADVAIATGAVDGTLEGVDAPWRQASIHDLGSSRVAVVTVSNMRRSRITFLTEQYRTLGGFERIAEEATLVTDEARGYKPLSHVWPLVLQDGVLHTLVAFQHLVSEEPREGLFAYVAVGPDENELLFVCELREGPGPTWGVLTRADLDGDGIGDLELFPRGDRRQRPLATFVWDPRERTYVPSVASDARPLIRWWSTTTASRVTFGRDEVLGDAVRKVASSFRSAG